MTLKDVLREIINTIEGGACAAVFRLDGEIVEVQASDPGLSIERARRRRARRRVASISSSAIRNSRT
jgi:hypothetical protein